MKVVDRESTKLATKTPKLAITSLLSKNFVFERKWGFDKMGTFGQNPCLFGENGYPFYQEHTVQLVIAETHATPTAPYFHSRLCCGTQSPVFLQEALDLGENISGKKH